MKVRIRIFPAAGIDKVPDEFEITPEKGCLSEVLALLRENLGLDPAENAALMFLHNGQELDIRKEAVFQDGDQLWLLPLLSGG